MKDQTFTLQNEDLIVKYLIEGDPDGSKAIIVSIKQNGVERMPMGLDCETMLDLQHSCESHYQQLEHDNYRKTGESIYDSPAFNFDSDPPIPLSI